MQFALRTCCLVLFVLLLAGHSFAQATAKSGNDVTGKRVSQAKKAPVVSRSALAMKPIEDNPKLPRVLLIGDSIAMGYTLPLRELLKDKANVHYPTENCHTSRQILEKLDEYLGDKPWDVIHFNCGIHDVTFKDEAGKAVKVDHQGKIFVPMDEYRDNLEKIIARLRKTGAALIWCSTTPVADGLPHRHLADIERYNAAAKEIMQRNQIPIDDLYATVFSHGKPKHSDGVHFVLEGQNEMAHDVVKPIEAALAERAAKKQ